MDKTSLVSVEDIAGDDATDTQLLKNMADEALSFLRSFSWCNEVKHLYLGLGVGGVFAAFFAEIEPAWDEVDSEIWVVVGDIPPAYLVTDDAPDPASAIEIYIELMEEWVEAVLEKKSIEELIPVNAEPTAENAINLKERLDFIAAIVRDFDDSSSGGR